MEGDADYINQQDHDLEASTSAELEISNRRGNGDSRKTIQETLEWLRSGLKNMRSGQPKSIGFFNEKTPTRAPSPTSSSSSSRTRTRYFSDRTTTEHCQTDIATVITLYNEESEEAERTVESLANQSFHPDTKHAIVLICDGIEKMSSSMKRFLISLFPNLPDLEHLLTDHSDNLLQVMASPGQSAEQSELLRLKKDLTSIVAGDNGDREQGQVHLTFVVQNLTLSGARRPIEVKLPKSGRQVRMDMSLILKLDNRAFADDLKAEMVFASDVGTLYKKSCLPELKRYLDRHADVSAVTGRQRGCEDESWYSLDRWYRNAQCYDYESSFASFMAAFHMAGMLPVIPGPCGLYRRQDMAVPGGPWDYYFETVHTPPENQDITMGNLLLAEDRVLCWAAALKTRERRYTAIVPRAVFYFAAETQLKTLAFQRRRWINGTVAGYIYLALRNPALIFDSPHTWFTKWFLWLLVMCQLLMFAVVAISPALFLITLDLSLEIISNALSADSAAYSTILFVIAIGTYLWFMIGHHLKSRFIAFLFYLKMCIHALTIIASVAAAVITLSRMEYFRMSWSSLHETEGPLAMAILLALLPVVISITTGGNSFFLMIRCFVHYYLFLPTLVATFGAYSFARTFDLSWGNRPPSQIKAEASTSGESEDALIKAKEKLREQSQATCGLIVMANVLLMLVVLMSRHVAAFFLLLGGLVFIWSAIQMVLSFVWYVYWSIKSGTNWLWNGLVYLLCCCCPHRTKGYAEEYAVIGEGALTVAPIISSQE
ncbi:chitin synthase [Acanthamoeba castellanii str. Neff]|uniref:chitin synthase n=1 Tax=Acanthamoeba castellanii (strain ATCC 30010 / Neff) TaxID=1257118 RepID=L8H2L7_ACACF|nr:chitin synthase [Acanthamoeba castellanii str. Neff]ELR18601.1 chitin synthase [Acanthamoeba castellanii str. Neff]